MTAPEGKARYDLEWLERPSLREGNQDLDAAPAADGDSVGRWLRALRRSRSDRWFGGVCGGLARSTGTPSWLWRLIAIAFALCGGSGIVAYVLLLQFAVLHAGSRAGWWGPLPPEVFAAGSPWVALVWINAAFFALRASQRA